MRIQLLSASTCNKLENSFFPESKWNCCSLLLSLRFSQLVISNFLLFGSKLIFFPVCYSLMWKRKVKGRLWIARLPTKLHRKLQKLFMQMWHWKRMWKPRFRGECKNLRMRVCPPKMLRQQTIQFRNVFMRMLKPPLQQTKFHQKQRMPMRLRHLQKLRIQPSFWRQPTNLRVRGNLRSVKIFNRASVFEVKSMNFE